MPDAEQRPPALSARQTLDAIKADARRYRGCGRHPGFWVTLSYRIRRLRKFGPLPYKLLIPLDLILGVIRRLVCDVQIPSHMHVGAGLYLPHPHGIVLNPRARIGEHVSIFQHVTLGEWHGEAPVIENNCGLYAGAKIFGGVTIGANSRIGANVAVSVDIPANSSVSQAEPQVRQRSTTEAVDHESASE